MDTRLNEQRDRVEDGVLGSLGLGGAPSSAAPSSAAPSCVTLDSGVTSLALLSPPRSLHLPAAGPPAEAESHSFSGQQAHQVAGGFARGAWGHPHGTQGAWLGGQGLGEGLPGRSTQGVLPRWPACPPQPSASRRLSAPCVTQAGPSESPPGLRPPRCVGSRAERWAGELASVSRPSSLPHG